MGQAQSGLSDDSDEPIVRKRTAKKVVKKAGKRSPVKPESKKAPKKSKDPPVKKGKKGKKKQESSSEGSGSDNSEPESDVESECPSSFLGDSDGEVEEDDDSGLGHGRPTNFRNSMFTAFGNFSVDLSANVGTAYLERYQLAPGQSIDYDQNQHKDLINEITQWFPFEHRPSGSALAVSRVVNWIVREPELNVVSLGGTVGNDDNGKLIDSTVGKYGIKNLLRRKV